MVNIWKSRGMSFGLKLRFLRATAFLKVTYGHKSCGDKKSRIIALSVG